MSVEAMSAGSAVGITTSIANAPSLGGEMSMSGSALSSSGPEIASSFAPISNMGSSINVGGTNEPNLNADIFSLSQLSTPTIESFDKVVPGNLAFTHTEIVWQAQPTPITQPSSLQADEVFEENATKIIRTDDIKLSDRVIQEINEIPDLISEPEVELSPVQAETPSKLDVEIQSFIQEAFLEPKIEIGKAMPIQTQQQEIIADAKQALRVKDALITTDVEPNITPQTVLRIFTQTQEMKTKSETLPKEKDSNQPFQMAEIYFEHDVRTDTLRQKTAEEAVLKVAEQLKKGEKQNFTGNDIAEKMPGNPQPEDVKSEILKEFRTDNDGSYESAVKEIRQIGMIHSSDDARLTIKTILNNNHAVRIVPREPSHEATADEVRKVLRSGIIFENNN